MKYDSEVDVLIVGSGAAGLTAALRARFLGLKPLVVEKTSHLGGTSAYSGGCLWIPQNFASIAAGISDSPADALGYMNAVVGDVGAASSPARKLAYLQQGPQMVNFLHQLGFNWVVSKGCPDYYPSAPGAMHSWGRTMEPAVFDLEKLGAWKQYMRVKPRAIPPLFAYESFSLTKAGSSIGDTATGLLVVSRGWWKKTLGEQPVTMGQSLVGQLLYLNLGLGNKMWRETSLVGLIQANDGSVLGAQVQQGDKLCNIRARKGVLLCAGGYARNKQMRQTHGPSPSSIEWTNVAEGDTGDAIVAGVKAGAATTLMDNAWWGPAIKDPNTGTYIFALQERSRPHSIIVDQTGSRFMNEAAPYVEAGNNQYRRNQVAKSIPAWLIIDSNHRKRYFLGSLMPRQEPKIGLEAGHIHKADSLDELAVKLSLPPPALQETVTRFNSMAQKGTDLDFHRGESLFERYFGDVKVSPNPSLGGLTTPPYYAVTLVPGDLGTIGGLQTDEDGRVLRKDASVISGLYAAGNTAASVMGRSYIATGATLGPALTFAFVAVNHMAQRSISTD
ncbi:hypothetical protein VHEMI08887 [[Torrubiella] hemipterigena]|uniref:FAD-dependent oxidoreductase 2 FAD-binding domain-containing protein n=1 Tax=[Torrubiella] hemipterigena TaxID=1531966 RepID=A0A0A1TPC5_9HYPO|nr:hypothetical protein VHEMI08887 [[Torrubiella] hemipterigena]